MTTEELMQIIDLPEDGREVVRRYELSPVEYDHFKRLFYEQEERFYTAVSHSQNEPGLLLSVFCALAADLESEYERRQISRQIYIDTFRDLTIWFRDAQERFGVSGIRDKEWLALSLKFQIFRLGRLQYEPDKDVLNIHIPADGPLDPGLCRQSLREADRFFSPKYRRYECTSWLLSPRLQEILPEDSNIMRFQQLFTVTKCVYSFPQAEERVFGRILENKSQYPERNELQKWLKQQALQGIDIGMGVGFIKRQAVR